MMTAPTRSEPATEYAAIPAFDSRLGNAAVRVYDALEYDADERGICNTPQAAIAERLSVTPTAVRYSLQQLDATGWITITVLSTGKGKGRRLSTTYRLTSMRRSPSHQSNRAASEPSAGTEKANPMRRPPSHPMGSQASHPMRRSPSGLPLEVPPVLSSEDSGVFPSSSPVLRSPVPENVSSPHVPEKKPGGVGGKSRGKAQPRPKVAATASRQRPAAPNRSARFIDAMAAIGLKLGDDYDMDGRDHGALKSSTADTSLLAEAYASLRTHGWGTEFDWSNLSVHHVVDRINVYREERNGRQVDTANGVAGAGHHVRGRPGTPHGRGEAPAQPGQYDHLIHEFE